MAHVTIETGGQLQPALSQEWLLTNGTGSFAMGTVAGCNTRRYHGLLCAATLPPVGRVMGLNRIGEILTLDGEVHELSVNQFGPDVFHPRGERYLKRFELWDTARWEYDVAGVRVVKEVLLCWKRDVAAVRYTIEPGKRRAKLELLPMVSLRDFHALLRGTDRHFEESADANHVGLAHGGTALYLHCDGATFQRTPDWWRNHWYAIEHERGQDHLEDLYTPGHFVLETSSDSTVTLVASLEPVGAIDWKREATRRAGGGMGVSPMRRSTKHAEHGRDAHATLDRLARAANDFVVGRKCPDGAPGVTVIAGYPWFADWGRDTMIALPGLFLTTKRLDEAARVLGLFAEYVSEGMIPNKFDDYTSEPQYNTVDASLWFIHACFEYLRAGGDRSTFERTLLPACRDVITGYSRGTRYGIRMDERDGLITQGDATTQLTWMDAKCDGVAFTPRQGKAVEINALWYNALELVKEQALAAKVRESFARVFWAGPSRGLYDVVDGDRRDGSIRPNQIFAVSLPHSPLEREQQRAVVEVVRRELLTPVGLRTLSASDSNFHPHYSGPQFQRDGAYHNGTVWPWLIGAFLEAWLKVNDHSDDAVAQARQWLAPLIESMRQIGSIGQIAEIFEAQPPHRPVGCPAQAWSVAEVLRLAALLEM